MNGDLVRIAADLVAPGKGIAALDETVRTLTKRFEALKIESTPESRRDYRAMLLTTGGAGEFISGAILFDETIRQHTREGESLVSVCLEHGITPGIKVDKGTTRMVGSTDESITEGLDGLRDRLAEYGKLGAKFAKWRAVFRQSDTLPTAACISANARALATYAALCQEQGLVPIVEPEVLMTGAQPIERCEAVTGAVLHCVFSALFEQRVRLEAMLLKPNMILPGTDASEQASAADVAEATLRCLRRHVPPAVPGIVFLSGGQKDVVATRHLDAIQRASGPKPWRLSFSYGRALQDAPLATWDGKPQNVVAAQRAFYQRARSNSLAARGQYTEAGEQRFG